MATDKPNPLCKDCWEPDPEQTRSQRDEVVQFDGSLNEVDDDDHANYVSNSSKDEVNLTDERETGSTENFDPGNTKEGGKLTRTKTSQKSRSRSRRRRKLRTQEAMESGKGKFDYEEKRGNDTSSEEEQILFKSKERKDTSSEEELGKKEFVCWTMEPVRRRKNKRTRSKAIGTTKMDYKEEPTAMEISESDRNTPRKENLKRSRAPTPERWREELKKEEKMKIW